MATCQNTNQIGSHVVITNKVRTITYSTNNTPKAEKPSIDIYLNKTDSVILCPSQSVQIIKGHNPVGHTIHNLKRENLETPIVLSPQELQNYFTDGKLFQIEYKTNANLFKNTDELVLKLHQPE